MPLGWACCPRLRHGTTMNAEAFAGGPYGREDVGIRALLGPRVRLGPGLGVHGAPEGAAGAADRALREGAPGECEAQRRRAAVPSAQPRASRRARVPRPHGPRG